VQGNDADIIVVTEKVKAFAEKLGLCVSKRGRESLDILYFVEENSVKTMDSRINQCIGYSAVQVF
jgi:hypothetical protein